MQDEINEKVVALSIRAGSNTARLTASMLKAAMRKYLEKHSQPKAQKAAGPKGKISYGELAGQNQGLTNIEITNQNIKSFEHVANKYKIDFALKKDKFAEPPRYLVFFKSRDVDAMTAAFKEFSARELMKSKRPSIQKRLGKYFQQSKAHDKQREKVKTKDRGQEL